MGILVLILGCQGLQLIIIVRSIWIDATTCTVAEPIHLVFYPVLLLLGHQVSEAHLGEPVVVRLYQVNVETVVPLPTSTHAPLLLLFLAWTVARESSCFTPRVLILRVRHPDGRVDSEIINFDISQHNMASQDPWTRYCGQQTTKRR